MPMGHEWGQNAALKWTDWRWDWKVDWCRISSKKMDGISLYRVDNVHSTAIQTTLCNPTATATKVRLKFLSIKLTETRPKLTIIQMTKSKMHFSQKTKAKSAAKMNTVFLFINSFSNQNTYSFFCKDPNNAPRPCPCFPIKCVRS